MTTNTNTNTNTNTSTNTNSRVPSKISKEVPQGLRYVEAKPEYGPSGVQKCPIRWGDLDQMLENEPEEYLNDPKVDYDVRVSYGIDEKGVRRTKKVRLVRIRQVEKLVPRSVMERRRRMKPFGAADPRHCTREENESMTQRADEVSITPISKTKQDEAEEKINSEQSDEASRITGTNNRIQCRNCGEHGHWTRDCHQPPSDSGAHGSLNGGSEGDNGRSRSTGYVPPSRRAGSRGPGASGSRYSQEDEPGKIRLSNLPESADEDDIRELGEMIGPVRNVFLVRDRATGDSRGFAFITFHDPRLTEKAIEKLDGHGFHHMILHVEKAKARRRD